MVKSGWDGEVIAVMCFEFLTKLFTEFTVHVCNMFTHLKLSKWLVEMTIPFLQSCALARVQACFIREMWFVDCSCK